MNKFILLFIFITSVYIGAFTQNPVIHYPKYVFSKEDSTVMRLMNHTTDLTALRDSLKKIGLNERYNFTEEEGDIKFQLNQQIDTLIVSKIDTLEMIVHPPFTGKPDPVTPPEPLPDLPIDRTKAVGDIPYTTDIVNGAVTYTVPIQLAESPKGFQPEVALHYNSMAGNGLAGYGWEVSGASMITYTGGNYFYDGESAPGETNAGGACFMLDGMRLIESIRDTKRVIYETETGNIKVYSYIPSKKYYFEVYYPDGRIGIYGYEGDNQPPLEYPLFKMTDRFSNYIEYSYRSPNYSYHISMIKYGTNGSQLGQVRFNYEKREDKNPVYITGWKMGINEILKSIQVYYGTSTLLYTYTLEHTYTDVNLLSKIRCRSGAAELNPLQFNYGHNRTDKGKLQRYTSGSLGYHYDSSEPSMSRFKMNPADNKEQMIVYPQKDNSTYGVTKVKGNNYEYGSTYHPEQKILVHTDIYGGINAVKILMAGEGFQTIVGTDINATGKEELVKLNYLSGDGNSRLFITTYSDTFSESQRVIYLPGTIKEKNYLSPYPRIFIFGDFNGDGKTNLLALSSNISPREDKLSANSAVHILNPASGVQHCQSEIPGFNIFQDIAFAADITGNGKSELCVINSTGLHVYSLINKKFQKITSYSGLTASMLETRTFLLGDINKDGKTDLLVTPKKNLYTGISSVWNYLFFTGEKFESTSENIFTPYTNGCEFLLQDMNGDKFPDLVIYNKGKISVILNKNGMLREKEESTTIQMQADSYLLSGDKSIHTQAQTGQFLVVWKGNVTPVSFSRNEEMERLMTSFYDSYGVKTQYKYNSFASAGRVYYYSKSPCVAFRAGFPVVTSVITSTNYPENQIIRSENYTYSTPVLHKQIRSFMGFTQIETYDNIRKERYVAMYAPDQWGALTSYETPAYRMAFRYRMSGRKNRTVLMTYKQVSDFLTEHRTTSEYSHDIYGNVISERTETYHNLKMENESIRTYPDLNNDNSHNKYDTDDRYNIDIDNSLKADTSYILPMQALGASAIGGKENESAWQIPYEPIEPNPTPIDPLIPAYPGIDLSFTNKQTIRRTFENVYTGTTYIVGNLTSETLTREDQAGNTVTVADTYTLNSLYLPVTHKQTYEGKQTLLEEFTYDANGLGNLVRHSVRNYEASNPLVTQYEYDTFSRITRTIQPMENLYTQASYNTKGLLSKVTDQKGLSTSYTYDNWGNATTIAYPDGITEKRTYSWSKKADEGVWTLTRTMTGQATTRSCYDQLGREIKNAVTRFDGTEMYTDKRYNPKGLLSHESRPYREGGTCKWNYIFYDEFDRVTQKRYATGSIERYSYDMSAVTLKKDGIYTTTFYDAQGNPHLVEDPAGIISYKYRPDGQIYKIIAPGNIVTTIEFDEWGRKIALDDPSCGRTTYAYDPAGNICEEKLASGKKVQYTYDKYNRLIAKNADGVLNTTYTYTNDNLAASEKSDNQIITYEYDSMRRLIRHTDHIPGEKWIQREMTYLKGDLPASTTYTTEDGVIATENYTYTNGYLTEVKLNNTTSVWKLIEEDENGRPVAAQTGPLERKYVYKNGLPSGRTVKKGEQTIQNFEYSFSATTGNLNWRSDKQHNKREVFTYDELNRLVGFDTRNITYDYTGNILQFAGIGSYAYSYKSYPYQAALLTLEEEESLPYQTQAITYNSMRRPSTIAECNYYATFAYGNEHQRIKMVIAKENTAWLTRYYLGNYETDESEKGTTERLYISADAYSAPAVYVKENGVWDIRYICRDYLGSITHITDKEGNLLQELSYDAWGRLRNPETHELYDRDNEPELLLARGYTGHEHLSQFGLINMNARLYDPALGRFLSPDPYIQAPQNSQNFNRYSYAMNNPLRYTDESGEFFGFITGFFKGMYKNPLKPHKWFERAARDFVNDTRIIQGLFKGNFKQILSRFTWELPQTILGLTSSLGYNWIGDVQWVNHWGGATVLNTTNMSSGKGVTLGSYIIGGSSIQANPHNSLFQHEYGHYLQSQAWGWAFLTRAGLPSLFDMNGKGKHNFHPVEQDANARAFIYFNKNVDRFYKTEDEYSNEKTGGWNFDKNPLAINGYGNSVYIDYKDPQQMELVNNLKIKPGIMDYLSYFFPYFPTVPLGVGIRNHNHYKNYYKP